MRAGGHGGFSLAEVIVSMFLLALVFGALLNLFPASLLAVDGTEARYQASGLAQTGLEQAALEPWSVLTASYEKITDHQLGDRPFHCVVQAAKISPSLCRITATVTWQQKGPTWKVEEICDVSELHR